MLRLPKAGPPLPKSAEALEGSGTQARGEGAVRDNIVRRSFLVSSLKEFCVTRRGKPLTSARASIADGADAWEFALEDWDEHSVTTGVRGA